MSRQYEHNSSTVNANVLHLCRFSASIKTLKNKKLININIIYFFLLIEIICIFYTGINLQDSILIKLVEQN